MGRFEEVCVMLVMWLWCFFRYGVEGKVFVCFSFVFREGSLFGLWLVEGVFFLLDEFVVFFFWVGCGDLFLCLVFVSCVFVDGVVFVVVEIVCLGIFF